MSGKIKYIVYLLKHKWYVMIECFKKGLIWRGLIHDLSKFYPDEFFPYSNYFYGKNSKILKKVKKGTGYYKPATTGDSAFDFAWLLHCKRNLHHWQWWILPNEKNGLNILSIPEPYLTEMICDWLGAGKAQGDFPPKDDQYLNVRKWYAINRDKLQLAPGTRKEIEKRIGL
ncbi:MAG: DUF5662 family protein [Candidatus Dojkabacteria bacterium]